MDSPAQTAGLLERHQEAPRPHSGMGIASFIIALVGGFAMFLTVAVAGVLTVQSGGRLEENSAAAVIVGLIVIVLVVLILAGLGLGIAGWVQRGRKPLFAVLGTVFNGLIVLGTIMLIVIGSTMS